MSSAHANLRAAIREAQGPSEALDGGAPGRYDDTIRDNVAVSYRKLERAAPAAADRLAEGHTRLHETLAGRCASACGYDSPDIFRRKVRGEDVLNAGDLYRLASSGQGEAVVAYLTPLLDMCGRDAVQRPKLGPTLTSAAAAVSESAGRLLATLVRAMEDGVLDATEREALRVVVDKLEGEVVATKAAMGSGRWPR